MGFFLKKNQGCMSMVMMFACWWVPNSIKLINIHLTVSNGWKWLNISMTFGWQILLVNRNALKKEQTKLKFDHKKTVIVWKESKKG